MRLPGLLLPLLLLLPSGCGSSDPRQLVDQGASALAAGDAQGAREAFERALVGLHPGDPDYARASMGRFQALVRLEPDRARDDFLSYAKEPAAKAGEGDYVALVNEFLRRDKTVQAIDVMDAGVKAFPKSEALLGVRKKVEEHARAANDPAALQKMKGLGYIGGDK
jgi:hypothetical protein